MPMSFNSQRDGILLRYFRPKTSERREFQFPTGWNSTLPKLAKFSGYPVGFNSQRDGILQKLSKIGWLVANSFNSQRDGILLRAVFFVYRRHRFQFPTGWNSTHIFSEAGLIVDKFQFPTGWNSTLIYE